MPDNEDAVRTFLYVALLDIVSDAVRGDRDAAAALEDDFWVQVITGLDRGTLTYGAFMLRVWKMRDSYRRGNRRAYLTLREVRQSLTFEGSTGEGTGNRDDGDKRDLPGVQPIGAA